MRKIYIVGKTKHYANWMEGQVVYDINEADLVVFTGGADVTPSYYGDTQNPKTGNDVERDAREAKIFRQALDLDKHILGICRGSQFTCAMSGGRLVQHQLNPHYIHPITVLDPHWDGTRGMIALSQILITSTHHQAMYPYDMPEGNYKLYGWTEGMLPFHENGEGKEISDKPFKEVEICYFPKTKVLGIQGHPEMMDVDKFPDTFEYLRKLLTAHLNNQL